ncbi:hypothetical protein VKS41_004801 [Umbelopsis sp. WA50703]
MTGLNAETQTVISSGCSTPTQSTQFSVNHKNWYQDKLQPYASEIVFVWNSILLFEDPVLTSTLLTLLTGYLGIIAIVGGTIYLGQETGGFGLNNFLQRRVVIAAAQRPRRDFSQICEILASFVDEIISLQQSMSELKQKQPVLFTISAAVSFLQAIAFGMVFSSYLLFILIVTSILIVPAIYEWGFSNHMNGENRTVMDRLTSWCTKPNFGCKSWVKIAEIGDDAEWEKDFSSIPETDDEIPVLVVPKRSNGQDEHAEDFARSNVDDIATLIKQLTEVTK